MEKEASIQYNWTHHVQKSKSHEKLLFSVVDNTVIFQIQKKVVRYDCDLHRLKCLLSDSFPIVKNFK